MADVPVALIQLDADKMKASNPEIKIDITNEGNTGFIRRKIRDFDRYDETNDSPYDFVVYNPSANGAVPLGPNSTLLGYKDVKEDQVVFSFTIPEAAILPDGERVNVVLSYSNVRLQLRPDASDDFKEHALFSIARGPLFRTGHNYTVDAHETRNGYWAYGILADVKMQVCYSGGKPVEYLEENGRKITATFLYTITDLDVKRGDTWIFSKVYGASNHRNYSEQIVFDIHSLVPGSKIHAPSEPDGVEKKYRDWMDVKEQGKVTGVLFYPTRNINDPDPGSFYSGFAAPVNNAVGAKYTIKSSGAHGFQIRTYLFSRPKEEQNFAQHKIQSVTVTELGGTIQTSEYGGNHDSALDPDNLESGDAILGPGTYTIPTGKTMTYTMRPMSEHMISKLIIRNGVDGTNEDGQVIVDKDELRGMTLNQEKIYQLATETCTLKKTGLRTYNFTFYNNQSDHYIEVQWTFDITVQKKWEDSNPDAQPDSVTFELLKDGKIYKTGSSSKANNWPDVVFTDLEDGPEYKVLERQVPNYRRDKEVTKAIENGNNVVTFTNVYDPEHKNIVVLKYWDDQKDQDGLRPESARIRLIGKVDGKDISSQQATMSVSVGWEHIFEKLPRMYDGKEIKYEIEELDVPYGYTVQLEEVHGDFILTNQHVPETLDIHVVKHWSGDSDHPETRPTSAVLRLHNVEGVVKPQTVRITAAGGWTYTFRGLQKYARGHLLNYVVIEDVSPDSPYVPTLIDQNQFPRVITNVYKPGKTRVSVVIDWDDLEDNDGFRPSQVEVELYANDKPTGKKITVKSSQHWYGFFDNLDKMKDGNKIKYSVRGADVKEYIPLPVKQHPDSPDEYSFIIPYLHRPLTRSIWVKKKWDDAIDPNHRPDKVTVRLFGDGILVRRKIMYAADGWQEIEFLNLPVYDDGNLIDYVISEDRSPNSGYSYYTHHADDKTYELTNKYNPGNVSVEVIKAWHGHHNQDGIRPEYITIHLFANGKDTGQTLRLNDANHWHGIFEVPQWDESNNDIEYTVTEDPVPDYTTFYVGDAKTALIVSNSHTPERVSFPLRKIWDDPGFEGHRPEEIGVRLYADGEILEARELTALTGWEMSFEHLPVYQNGKKIQYTLTEDKVPDYAGKVDLEAGIIENTYIGDKTANLPPTGDKSHLFLWLLGAFAGLAGIGLVIKKRPPR